MMNYNFCKPQPYMENRKSMRVIGAGTLKVEPNIAIVTLGVVTENLSLQAAQEENALKTTAVINQLYQMGISRKQIKTASYSIEPKYDYVEGKQIFRGYRVTNMLSITLKDLTKVGEVIDSAVASGANRVDGITFTLEDPSIYYNKALSLAVKNATEKAIEVSRTLAVQLNTTPIKVVEESQATPYQEASMVKLVAAPTTPILSGEINITARIEAIFVYR